MKDCGIRLSNWSDLGTDLGVPIDKRQEFRQRGLSTQESLEECLEYWIRNVPGNKSWEILCSIVDKHEKDTANQMRTKLGMDNFIWNFFQGGERIDGAKHSAPGVWVSGYDLLGIFFLFCCSIAVSQEIISCIYTGFLFVLVSAIRLFYY